MAFFFVELFKDRFFAWINFEIDRSMSNIGNASINGALDKIGWMSELAIQNPIGTTFFLFFLVLMVLLVHSYIETRPRVGASSIGLYPDTSFIDIHKIPREIQVQTKAQPPSPSNLSDSGVQISGVQIFGTNKALVVRLTNSKHPEPMEGVQVFIIEIQKWSSTNKVFHPESQFHNKPYFPIRISGSEKLYLHEPRDYEFLKIEADKIRIDSPQKNQTIMFKGKNGFWKVGLKIKIADKEYIDKLYFSHSKDENMIKFVRFPLDFPVS